MANKKISQLSAAGALTGSELVEVVQTGANVKTTTQAIADLADTGGGGPTTTLVSDSDLQQTLTLLSIPNFFLNDHSNEIVDIDCWCFTSIDSGTALSFKLQCPSTSYVFAASQITVSNAIATYGDSSFTIHIKIRILRVDDRYAVSQEVKIYTRSGTSKKNIVLPDQNTLEYNERVASSDFGGYPRSLSVTIANVTPGLISTSKWLSRVTRTPA